MFLILKVMRILEAAPNISLRRIRFISACLKAIFKDERRKGDRVTEREKRMDKRISDEREVPVPGSPPS